MNDLQWKLWMTFCGLLAIAGTAFTVWFMITLLHAVQGMGS